MQVNDDVVQITKYVPGDIEFMKQQPVHPRDRLKKKNDFQFVKQQPSHPRDRLKRKIKKHNKPYDVQATKITPVHPRERLKRKLEQKAKEGELLVALDDEVKITKVQPLHSRERLQRALRRKTPKILVDKEVLEDLPYFNTKIKIDETNKLRRKKAIFDQIINQLPPNNDTYYIKHKKKKDTFTVKKGVKRRPVLKCKYNSTAAAANAVKKKYAKLDRRRKNN